MSLRRRARQKVREQERRVAGPTAITGMAGISPEMPDAWIHYSRGESYGGGGKYRGGRARYGYSRYGVGATYGYAVRTYEAMHYGVGWYGRNGIYGSSGTISTHENYPLAVYGSSHYGRNAVYGS